MKTGAFGLILLMAGILVPFAGASDFFLFVVTMVLVYAIVGFGMGILYGHSGQFSIGGSGFYAIGAYTSVILASYHVDWSIGFLAAIALCALAGGMLAYISSRMFGFGLAIVTFGFAVIVHTLILYFASLTGGIQGIPVPNVTLFGVPFSGTRPIYFATLILTALFACINVLIDRSFVGRNMLAIKGDPLVAGVLGIRVQRYRAGAFIYSAITAGVGGSLFVLASRYIAGAAFQPMLSVTFFALILIGGPKSIWGILGGAVFVIWFPTLLTSVPGASTMLFGLATLLAMLFAEDGLFGLFGKAWQALLPRIRTTMLKDKAIALE